MNHYYKSLFTKKIVTERYLSYMDDVFGPNWNRWGVFVEIEPPSVIECIRHGNDLTAILRYREIHSNATLTEARKMVAAMKKDVRYFDKKNAKH